MGSAVELAVREDDVWGFSASGGGGSEKEEEVATVHDLMTVS